MPLQPRMNMGSSRSLYVQLSDRTEFVAPPPRWRRLGGSGRQAGSGHSPLIAELAGEAVQVVDVLLGPHDHFKGWYEFAAGGAVPRHTEQPETQRHGVNPSVR